jgi:hypothetical protein
MATAIRLKSSPEISNTPRRKGKPLVEDALRDVEKITDLTLSDGQGFLNSLTNHFDGTPHKIECVCNVRLFSLCADQMLQVGHLR